MIKKLAIAAAILLLAYLFFWPVPVDPDKFEVEKAPELAGDYLVNSKLHDVRRALEGTCLQCEDVDYDSAGYIYGGTEDGRIIKVREGEEAIVLAETGGRPLGIHFDAERNLIVCDAKKGLLSVSPSGDLKVLVTEHGGRPFKFTDDVDIAADGMIYFSDASDKFDNDHYKHDFIEHRPHGRLLKYDPASGQTEMLMDDLYFANGIALSMEDSFVLVNETSAHRVMRYWLKGGKQGTSDVFIDNLPFYPDGISRGENGIFWIAMMSPRNSLLESLSGSPFIRKVIVRLPQALMPKPKNYSFVLGVNEDGEVIYNLQDPDAKFAQITSIQQYGDTLFLGSLYEPAIGIYILQD